MAGSRGSRGSQSAVLALLFLSVHGVSAIAEDRDPSQERSAEEAGAQNSNGELVIEGARPPRSPRGPAPDLDSLLQLPSGFITGNPRAVAGAGEGEWRRRFTKATDELAEARARLESIKTELDGVAETGGSTQWSIAPPGGGGGGGGGSTPTSSPLSFRLRQQLREERDTIESKEKAMRELRIQADLAGVPETWRVARSQPAESPAN
jgi:hypothetical protein